jgi:predicted O-linked N-acetylglucosamine transferase (SPINDLY family)
MPDGLAEVGLLAPTEALNLALAEQRDGATARARMRMEALRARLPQWEEVPLRLAELHRAQGEAAAAIAAYEAVLELDPGRPEALIGLGSLLLPRGEVARAQSLFLRCCGVAPDRAEAWDALGMALLAGGEAPAAESALAQAALLAPADIGIALRRAEAAQAAGNAAGELARLDLAVTHDPDNPALLAAQGLLAERAGMRAAAIDRLEIAAALAPGHAAPHGLLAQALVRANRIAEALPALDRAIGLAPEDLTLRNNRAAALIRLNRHREARDALEDMLDAHGPHSGVLCNLSNALVSLGRQDEGVAVALRAIAREPDLPLAWRTLCNALPYCEGIGGRELLAVARRAAGGLHRGVAPRFANSRDPGRRLRVGLLSPTLKTHPVGWFTVAGFEALDPAAFELHALALDFPADPIQRRFRAIAASWTAVDSLPPAELVADIRGLGLDVLVELGGHGDQGLLGLCAQRLAPVQVKWVGSQNHSTGMAEMDWFITDRWETPAGLREMYAERLLELPDGYVCYSPPAYAPPVGPLPARAAGRVTFGCFNNLAKITRATIACWAEVLGDVPGSRLVVKCHQMGDGGTADRLRRDFARLGIDPARLDLRGGSPHRALLAEYGDIDIVLDPFPYTGGLTTCEALWMGVPVVTLPGEIFAARHSASHLCNVGLDDWVAGGVAEYRAIARRWAADLRGLAGLRAGLRARVKASPLCDAPRFGRSLGAALRHAWRDWCARA